MGLTIEMRRKNKNRKSGKLSTSKATFEPLEQRELLTVSAFQNGAGGYSGQAETVLYSREPGANFGGESSMSPDQQDANGVRQGLLKFDDIIGAGAIPLGAKINSAEFSVNVINDSNSAMQMSLYRLQVPWNENLATWNSFGEIGGIQASEGEASSLPPDGILFQADTSASGKPDTGLFDVTRSLEYWVTGAENNGWLIESAATNGWDYTTSEAAEVSDRPKLTVDWEVPSTNEFKVLSASLLVEEGATAKVDIARFGNLAEAASVNYSITAGTAGTEDFTASSGTIEFESGQAFTQIDLATIEDDALEGDETVIFTLGDVETTIKIGDDDALINEVFANVSNASADETNQEYIELIGTPGASLDGYTFVVFEGEEEEVPANATKDGAGTGVADFVFDLSGHSFGDNGLLVIAPTEWAFAGLADPATTIINTELLDGEGGVLEDYSQTYALFRGGSFSQGTDYDTEGTYEDETNQAVGIGVGILDQLPAGTSMVDSVGTVEGGGSDRDRTLTTADLGNPGVHVHQPERNRNVSSNGVTSDAISRRLGVSIPNSIGVWYNGDVLDSDPAGTLAYANDTFWTSVVTPDGAVLTPGAPNQLRTVYFSLDSQDAVVDEGGGTVTLTMERTGAADEEVTASYVAVAAGSAIAGEDFVAAEAEVTFAPGEFEKQVEIEILTDDFAEGFETFRVDITSVSDGYLITNGRPTQSGAVNGEATVTISDGDVELGIFQNDNNDYEGTTDAHIDAHLANDKFGQDLVVRVDNNKGEFGDEVFLPQQGLLKFDDLNSVVPAGSTVFSGFVTLNVVDGSGGDVSLYRMLQPWDQVQTTWNNPQGDEGDSISNGITPDDIEAVAVPDAVVPDASRTGKVQVPLDGATLQSWVNGSMPNYGWQVVNNSGELYAFSSSEAFALDGQGLSVKPELTIVYNPPQAGEAGTGAFSQNNYVVTEGGNATITVNRVGGTVGATTIDWSIDQSTGTLEDISSAASGSLAFADGELFKSFTISTVNDSDVEINENLVLNVGGDSATLTIRDNDFDAASSTLLLSEMFINSPGNDPPSEFIEISGDPGLPLGSMYYVAVEGEAGDTEGLAEKVVDIGGFSNGSNGHTILTPDAPDFANNVPLAATQIDALGSIATENVSSANNSTTFMLVYSPEQRLAEFDYDWNNDGTLELPASAVIIDSIAFDSSSDDTDLTYVPGGSEIRNAGALDVDALSRRSGNMSANDADAWYGGDLVPAGDDYILYELSESFGVPANGTLTPGDANTAAGAVQANVVSVDGATGNVKVTFSSPISQVLLGLGTADPNEGAGITISAVGGGALASVDAVPVVESGFDTDTLVLSFTGSGTNNGAPPAGSYQLNIVGNGLVANGLSVDTGASGVAVLEFAHDGQPEGGGLVADFNGDGETGFSDFLVLSANFGGDGGFAEGDTNGDGKVDFADFLALSAEFGQTAAAAVDAVFAGA